MTTQVRKVIINQGVPGSGKSTKTCNEQEDHTMTDGPKSDVCSADNFFIDEDSGEYKFDPAKIGEAHATCFRRFIYLLTKWPGDPVTGWKPYTGDVIVYVDNTNLHLWEMAPYYLAAKAFGFDVEIRTFKCEPKEAHARNEHGVPLEVIERMAASMEEPHAYWDVTHTVYHTEAN